MEVESSLRLCVSARTDSLLRAFVPSCETLSRFAVRGKSVTKTGFWAVDNCVRATTGRPKTGQKTKINGPVGRPLTKDKGL